MQPVLDANQSGAGYGSTDHPLYYLLLLLSYSFAPAFSFSFYLFATCSNLSVY